MPNDPQPCTPWQRVKSYARRHMPLLLGAVLLLVYLVGPSLLTPLTFLAHDAPPITPGQDNLDGAQILAAQQAGGWMQLGLVTSKLIVAAAFFCVGVALVWTTMHYVTPALPKWAKRNFSTLFLLLSPTWQFVLYCVVWLCLLLFFALCLLSASLAQ